MLQNWEIGPVSHAHQGYRPLDRTHLDVDIRPVVENHVSIVEPTATKPPVLLETLTAFLGSAAADTAFRCVSGSVAVSAYELRALPLPRASQLEPLSCILAAGAGKDTLEEECSRLYHSFAAS
jgi:adenine-specific DNA-methyltransferase